MTDKSHAGLEVRKCLVCEGIYQTGNVLLDTRIVGGKLRESLHKYTLVGNGLCPQHEATAAQGWVALVEVTNDEQDGYDCEDGRRMSPEHAKRTGKSVLIRRDKLNEIRGKLEEREVPDGMPVMFVDARVFQALIPDEILASLDKEPVRSPADFHEAPPRAQ